MARTPIEAADHVVVGAGAAGCVLAARLSEDPSARVVLLEAGPRSRKLETRIPAAFNKLFHSELDWDYATAPEPGLDDRELYWPRGKAVGGSTVMNAQMWVRGSRADYDAWAAAGCEGWGWDDVLPTFRSIERCGRGMAAWRGTTGPLQVNELRSPNPMTLAFVEAAQAAGIPRTRDVNDPDHHDGVDITQVCQRGGRRHSVADAYLGPARRRPNLAVVAGAHATEVVIAGGRATGVRYLQDGVARTIHAGSEVYLCGGSINTPQLLMGSGIGPADHLAEHGIDCRVDLAGVGSNLQDHLFVGVITLSAEGVAGSLLTAESKRNLAAWGFRGRGMLSSNVGEALAMVRTDPSLPAADIELIFAPVPFIDHGLTVPPGHGISIGAVLLQPESRGTIRLRSADPLTRPVISPAYLSDPAGRDLATLTAGVRKAQQVMGESPLAAYVDRPLEPLEVPIDDEGWHRFVREQAETLYHPVGTARMGPADDPASVVDPQLRVLGVAGLRVVDASVMPTINRGHTQAPTMLIAERAAALVAGS
jgi:choline dehydrogenase